VAGASATESLLSFNVKGVEPPDMEGFKGIDGRQDQRMYSLCLDNPGSELGLRALAKEAFLPKPRKLDTLCVGSGFLRHKPWSDN